MQDTGAGIPENLLTRIFDPCFTTKPADLRQVIACIEQHVHRPGPRPRQAGLFTPWAKLPPTAEVEPAIEAANQDAVAAWFEQIYANRFRGDIDEVAVWNQSLATNAVNYVKHRRLSGAEEGLVGLWHLDEGGGTTTANAVAGGGAGTLVSNPSWVVSTAPIAPSPVAGTALKFDGVDDQMVVPHAADLNAFPLTVTAWIKTSRVAVSYDGIVSKYVAASANGYSLHLCNGRLAAFYFRTGTDRVYAADPGAAWSPDEELLAFADGTSASLEAGKNLWAVKPDGTGWHQITGFTDTNGFRHGALWSPGSDALVGAASIGNVNGIWIVPLTPDRDACGGDAVRLPTAPGDPIGFVGSVFIPPPPPAVFVRGEEDGVTVFWRQTAWSYLLQAASDPAPTADWVAIAAPYTLTSDFLEHPIPYASLPSARFFRLRRP